MCFSILLKLNRKRFKIKISLKHFVHNVGDTVLAADVRVARVSTVDVQGLYRNTDKRKTGLEKM